MGRTYTCRCDRCGYEACFNEGHGYHIHRQALEVYLKNKKILFHYKTHRVLHRLVKEGEGYIVDAGFKIYKCPHCKLLYEKIEVKVLHDNQVIHKSEFRCLKCRSRLRLTNIHRLKSSNCPVCRNDSFHIDRHRMVLWNDF